MRRVGPTPSTDALIGPVAAPDVHVMTFNIRRAGDGMLHRRADRWSWREPAVRDLLAAERPTLLGLQEALPRVMASVRDSLGAGHRALGIGRGSDGRGEGAPIVFDPARLELHDWGQHPLSDEPHRPGSTGWGNLIPRVVVWAEFAERATRARFLAVNTHFDHLSSRSRLRSAISIRRLVSERGLPAVVMGDLNAGAGSPAVRALHEHGVLADSWDTAIDRRGARWGTYPGYRAPRIGGRVLDRILTTPGVRVRTVAVNTAAPGGRRPSDHLPVHAVLRFEEEQA